MAVKKSKVQRVGVAPAEITLRGGGRTVKVHVRDGEGLLPKDLTAPPTGRPPTAGGGGRSGPAKVSFKEAGAKSYGGDAIAQRLVAVLGSNTVADLLGVARDRPGRWARGAGTPDAAHRAALADLDALVGHLLAAFTSEQASLWLTGDNSYLGARPLGVYRTHGSGPVVEAIRAHQQGAFG
jgi:hypothetical protein